MNKKDIRKLFLEKRKLYSKKEINKKTILIKKKLFSLFNFYEIKIVHTFLPIKENNEVNTFLIINEIFNKFKHIKIIVPTVDFKNKRLIHKYYEKDTILKKNKWNVPEPITSKICNINEINNSTSIILVPLLAFDKEGNRVGYGGGYYDKFLQYQNKAIKIGLSIEECIDKIVDVNEYDIKLNYSITPNKIYNF